MKANIESPHGWLACPVPQTRRLAKGPANPERRNYSVPPPRAGQAAHGHRERFSLPYGFASSHTKAVNIHIVKQRRQDPRFDMVLERTRVVRPPRQSLDTFGVTKIRYHLVTEPAFREVNPAQTVESVVRGGVVKAERPQVVTPYFLLNTESFSAGAREFLEHLSRSQGPDSPGLLYSYKNEPGGMDIVSGGVDEVAGRIARDLDARESRLEAVIIGIDELMGRLADQVHLRVDQRFGSQERCANAFRRHDGHGRRRAGRCPPPRRADDRRRQAGQIRAVRGYAGN